MRGGFVDGQNGEEEVLSGSPWPAFWGKNGEADHRSGRQLSKSVTGRRDTSRQ